ncbi:MAG: elongation factor Ts, partial [Betaproteobacteria bacterium]|nr:elongation factor Ts [Betaproteobacteria bacterium]
KADIGTIYLDAIFSPIRRVSYDVEEMRVGDKTNFNRLRMTIETDGTISPREALERSVKTMIEQLAAIVELNSETDFVAKNDDFVGFSHELAKLVAEHCPADVDALSALQSSHGTSVEAHRTALVGKIGENMNIRRFERIEAEGQLASYLHGGSKIGVLVDLVGADEQLAKDLAMHIAASKPKSLDRRGVPEELIEAERRVATEKAAESGKPAEIVAKMVEGTVQKFLKEVTLLGQVFVKDDKLTIEQLLKQRQASVPRFVLYVVGEGMEKKTNDFAAEVAAQAAAAAAAR